MKELNALLPALLKGSPLNEHQQKKLFRVADKLEKQPDRNAEEWFAMGVKAQLENDFDEAEFCFSEAIRVQEDFEAAYQRRATVYSEQDNNEAALSDLEKAIELDPEYLQAYNTRAAVYTAMERFDEALKDIDLVLEKDAENVTARAEKASIFEAQGEYAAAAEQLTPLVQEYKDEPDLYSKRALFYLFGDEPEKAIDDLLKAQKLQGSNAVNDFNLALAFGQLAEHAKDSLQRFERAFKKHPTILSSYKEGAKPKDWQRLLGKFEEILKVQRASEDSRGAFYRQNLVDFLDRQLSNVKSAD